MEKKLIKIIYFCALVSLTNVNEIIAQGRNAEWQGRTGEKYGRSGDRPGKSGEAKGRNKEVPGVPIDGGISALLAAGAAYGLKKLYDRQKTE